MMSDWSRTILWLARTTPDPTLAHLTKAAGQHGISGDRVQIAVEALVGYGLLQKCTPVRRTRTGKTIRTPLYYPTLRAMAVDFGDAA